MNHLMNTRQYQALVERVKDGYDARIRAILEQLAAACRELGLVTDEVADNHCDDFRWDFNVATAQRHLDTPDNRKTADVTFEIAESLAYEGSREGINFMVTIVHWGGLLIGGYSPYNYTNRVWVNLRDPEVVEERFTMMEQMDYIGTARRIHDRLKERRGLMDPTECLAAALELCEAGDGLGAAEKFNELAQWLEKGGFVPDIHDRRVTEVKYTRVTED